MRGPGCGGRRSRGNHEREPVIARCERLSEGSTLEPDGDSRQARRSVQWKGPAMKHYFVKREGFDHPPIYEACGEPIYCCEAMAQAWGDMVG